MAYVSELSSCILLYLQQAMISAFGLEIRVLDIILLCKLCSSTSGSYEDSAMISLSTTLIVITPTASAESGHKRKQMC